MRAGFLVSAALAALVTSITAESWHAQSSNTWSPQTLVLPSSGSTPSYYESINSTYSSPPDTTTWLAPPILSPSSPSAHSTASYISMSSKAASTSAHFLPPYSSAHSEASYASTRPPTPTSREPASASSHSYSAPSYISFFSAKPSSAGYLSSHSTSGYASGSPKPSKSSIPSSRPQSTSSPLTRSKFLSTLSSGITTTISSLKPSGSTLSHSTRSRASKVSKHLTSPAPSSWTPSSARSVFSHATSYSTNSQSKVRTSRKGSSSYSPYSSSSAPSSYPASSYARSLTSKPSSSAPSSSTVPSSVHTSVYVTPTPLPKTRWPHQKVVGYYSGDMAQFMEPDSVPWKLLTHVSYAFAFINPDFTINVSAVASKEVMGSVFEEAAKHKVAGVLSVGGWGPGSSEFSAMVSKVDNRFAFVQSVYDLVTAYPSISGLDIDWEYPGRVSAPGVPYNAKKDIPGFLNLLAELRAVFGSHFTLSAALAGVTPFSSDVRKIAELLDWAVVMEFDFATGELNQTTSNAPLLGSLSGESGVKAWYEAGLPMEKMIYGIPGYGRAFNLTDYNSPSTLGLQNPCSTTLPMGDSDQPTNTGVWKWRNLIDEGVLIAGETPGVYTGGWDWQQRFDYTTISPYVWNNITGEFITYDDPVSISHKREFAHKHGMQGLMLWEVPYDSYNGELMHYMRASRH